MPRGVRQARYGNTLVLDEQRITETNGPPPGSPRWCIKTLTLAPEDSGGQTLLAGTWKQDGGNAGRVYLQRVDGAYASLGGEWGGSFDQGSTTFAFELALNQAGSTLEGVGTTRRDAAFGTMRVRGRVVGQYVILQETEVLTGSANSSWCLKTLEMKLTHDSGRSLDGTWSALICVPGTVRLQQ